MLRGLSLSTDGLAGPCLSQTVLQLMMDFYSNMSCHFMFMIEDLGGAIRITLVSND